MAKLVTIKPLTFPPLSTIVGRWNPADQSLGHGPFDNGDNKERKCVQAHRGKRGISMKNEDPLRLPWKICQPSFVQISRRRARERIEDKEIGDGQLTVGRCSYGNKRRLLAGGIHQTPVERASPVWKPTVRSVKLRRGAFGVRKERRSHTSTVADDRMGQNLSQIGLQPTRVHRQCPFRQQNQVVHLIQRVPTLDRPRRTDLPTFTAIARIAASVTGRRRIATVTQSHVTSSDSHSNADAHFSPCPVGCAASSTLDADKKVGLSTDELGG